MTVRSRDHRSHSARREVIPEGSGLNTFKWPEALLISSLLFMLIRTASYIVTALFATPIIRLAGHKGTTGPIALAAIYQPSIIETQRSFHTWWPLLQLRITLSELARSGAVSRARATNNLRADLHKILGQKSDLKYDIRDKEQIARVP